jgi:hypothetical protein
MCRYAYERKWKKARVLKMRGHERLWSFHRTKKKCDAKSLIHNYGVGLVEE